MHALHKKTVTYDDNTNSNLHNYFKELGEQIKLLTQSMALLSHEVQAIKTELSNNSKNINTLFNKEQAVFDHLQHPDQPFYYESPSNSPQNMASTPSSPILHTLDNNIPTFTNTNQNTAESSAADNNTSKFDDLQSAQQRTEGKMHKVETKMDQIFNLLGAIASKVNLNLQ